MREYGKVYSSFWQSPEIRSLSEDGRALAMYLLTCPHANLIGCFRLPDAYAADDLQWSCERVAEGFRELSESHFLTRDEGTKWVFIHKYLRWNEFENPNVAKAASKAFEQIPSIALKPALALALLEFAKHLHADFKASLETLRKPFANPEPEPEPEPLPEPEPEPEPEPNPVAPTVASDRTPRPKRAVATREPPKGSATWEAYSAAYRRRYGVEPVRNAKANALCCQVVDRLGAEEAPQVADFFVGHQKSIYTSRRHPLDLLVHDAEALRTDWLTGRQSTVAAAVQGDKTQQNASAFGRLIERAKAEEAAHAER